MTTLGISVGMVDICSNYYFKDIQPGIAGMLRPAVRNSVGGGDIIKDPFNRLKNESAIKTNILF